MRTLIVILFSIVLSIKSFACSCIPPACFCETKNYNNYPIFIGIKIIGLIVNDTINGSYYGEAGMKFLIIETLRGTAPSDTIAVWGDINHPACDGGTSYIDIGDTVVLNIPQDTFSLDSIENLIDFFIPADPCNTPMLFVSDDTVRGNITRPSVVGQVYNYEHFHLQFDEFKNGLDSCTVGTSAEELNLNKLSVQPNPVSDILYVNFVLASNIKITLYNIQGQKLYSDMISKASNTIDLTEFKAGLYFLELESENFRRVSKLIKE